MQESRWRDPRWLTQAYEWIDARVDRTGTIEQSHVRPWSTVLRVPTGAGPVWFKATDESLRHEAGLVELLSRRRPAEVPPPLAVERERGWLLMSDGGETLRAVTARERSLERWHDVLARYARVQLATAGDVDALLALGVPDRRLARLPAAYRELVARVGAGRRFQDAAARVDELCAELDAYGIAELIQHDDLHDAQVFVRDGRHLILDWGDACVTHPFLSLSVPLEGTLAWGLDDVEGSVDTGPFRDAYLRPFAESYAGDLVAAARVALRLGWVCRAINGHVPGDDAQTLTRLRMFLDGRP